MDSSDRAGESDAGIEYEICIGCGDITDIDVETPIDMRNGYIEGAGQICSRCNYTNRQYREEGYIEFT